MDLSGVGAALRERLPELGERMAQRIRAEVESYTDDSLTPFDSLRESCESNADLVLRHFASGAEPDVRPAQETGRLRAEQGVPLADTLHAYRVGFEYLWSQMVEEAPRHPEVTDAQLVAGSSRIWALFGRYAEAVAAAYREAGAELALRREARRSGWPRHCSRARSRTLRRCGRRPSSSVCPSGARTRSSPRPCRTRARSRCPASRQRSARPKCPRPGDCCPTSRSGLSPSCTGTRRR